VDSMLGGLNFLLGVYTHSTKHALYSIFLKIGPSIQKSSKNCGIYTPINVVLKKIEA
jgi:hypothetical protein